MCLLGRLPAARWGSSPSAPWTSLPVYPCPGEKTRRSGRPGDREWVGARHAVEVAGAHRLVRGAARCGFRRPGLRLGARGGLGREKVAIFGQASPSPPPHTHARRLSSPLASVEAAEETRVWFALRCLRRMFGSNLLGTNAPWRREGLAGGEGGPRRSAGIPSLFVTLILRFMELGRGKEEDGY